MYRRIVEKRLYDLVELVKEGKLRVPKSILKEYKIDYNIANSFIKNYPLEPIIVSETEPLNFESADEIFGIKVNLKQNPKYYLICGFDVLGCILKLFGSSDIDNFIVNIETKTIHPLDINSFNIERDVKLGNVYDTFRLIEYKLIDRKILSEINSTLQDYNSYVVILSKVKQEELNEIYVYSKRMRNF